MRVVCVVVTYSVSLFNKNFQKNIYIFLQTFVLSVILTKNDICDLKKHPKGNFLRLTERSDYSQNLSTTRNITAKYKGFKQFFRALDIFQSAKY